jgi:hypothetical protein
LTRGGAAIVRSRWRRRIGRKIACSRVRGNV